MLFVFVERDAPADLLRSGIDLDLTGHPAQRGQQLTTDGADRSVTGERDPLLGAAAALDDRLVAAQIERDDDRARTIGRRQGSGLPATGGQPQRGVLELRLGRGEGHRQLAQHLRVGVQRVARFAPGAVGELGPPLGHAVHATSEQIDAVGFGVSDDQPAHQSHQRRSIRQRQPLQQDRDVRGKAE